MAKGTICIQPACRNGTTAATPQDIYNQAIVPRAVALDLSKLNYTVTWTTTNSPYHVTVVNGNVVAVSNFVTVQLSYQWVPEGFLGGMTLTSTSVTAGYWRISSCLDVKMSAETPASLISMGAALAETTILSLAVASESFT